MKSHYETLSVSQTAPVEVIKGAYKALSQKHHPDKGGDPETMAAINEAWRVLSDPDARAAHDMRILFANPRVQPDASPEPASAPEPAPERRGSPFVIDEALLRQAKSVADGHRRGRSSGNFGVVGAVAGRMFGL